LLLFVGTTLVMLAVFSSVALGVVAYFAGHSEDPDATLGAALVGFTGLGMALVFTLAAIPCLLAGWGLRKRRRWARVLAIIVAAVGLLRFPLGTAFGIYVLWVLLSKRTEEFFEPAPVSSE
jgi:hypothetical protein